MVRIAPPDNKNVVRGEALEELLKAARTALEKLISAISTLPVVKKNGYSECPNAKDLYDKKEEYEQQVAGYVATLQATYEFVAIELATSKLNLEKIGINTSKLQLEGPREKFTEAQYELWGIYHRARKEKAAIRSFLNRAEPILKQSQKIKFPDGKQQEPSQIPSFGPSMPNDGGDPIIDKSTNRKLDPEIKEYIDMPPARKS